MFSLILAIIILFPGINGQEIFNEAPAFEPSGITIYQGAPIVVDDGGDVIWLKDPEQRISLGSLDLEGVTVENNNLWAVIEATATLVRFDFTSGVLETRSAEHCVGYNASSGAEALTYNPIDNTFLIGKQADGRIYIVHLGITVECLGSFPTKYTDLSGMEFEIDPFGIPWIWVIWDTANKGGLYRLDGTLIAEWDLPLDSTDQEGIANSDYKIWLTEDSRGVREYDCTLLMWRDNLKGR